ncbi:hypothetical protein [Thalassococcus lentus]|uniref:DUF2125 domain-containing protein n=1 Tax=Thalassococcus lentus TaxID=1210524 RepID=A0ABT4XT02_9RHOB|nr:hypothetical protein [Thalassococcus lentus]MDA7424963.1 hypothetical protein [Thalassococcus lentus]
MAKLHPSVAAGWLLSVYATTVSAETLARELRSDAIDTALAEQIDFRSIVFEPCLAKPTCAFGALTVTAEREVSNGVWEPALIYWDPVDGFGVMGGQQNDEIDIDERLVVQFTATQQFTGIWMSDLFIGEETHYQNWPESSDDVEIADLAILDGTRVAQSKRINGIFKLPSEPFNEQFSDLFTEDGDLLNRVIFEEGDVKILVPDAELNSVVMSLDRVAPAKESIFLNLESEQIELDEIIGSATDIPVFPVGSDNAARILEIREDQQALLNIIQRARAERELGEVSNGELGWYPTDAITGDRIEFTAGYRTSSDYSVAGIMLAQPTKIAGLEK